MVLTLCWQLLHWCWHSGDGADNVQAWCWHLADNLQLVLTLSWQSVKWCWHMADNLQMVLTLCWQLIQWCWRWTCTVLTLYRRCWHCADSLHMVLTLGWRASGGADTCAYLSLHITTSGKSPRHLPDLIFTSHNAPHTAVIAVLDEDAMHGLATFILAICGVFILLIGKLWIKQVVALQIVFFCLFYRSRTCSACKFVLSFSQILRFRK